jgi:hypothetical protein
VCSVILTFKVQNFGWSRVAKGAGPNVCDIVRVLQIQFRLNTASRSFRQEYAMIKIQRPSGGNLVAEAHQARQQNSINTEPAESRRVSPAGSELVGVAGVENASVSYGQLRV